MKQPNPRSGAPLWIPIRYFKAFRLRRQPPASFNAFIEKKLQQKIRVKPSYIYQSQMTVDLKERYRSGVIWKGEVAIPEAAVRMSGSADRPVTIRPGGGA